MSKQVLFTMALEALHMAQQLEEYSAPMINNAYQGKTIKEASGNKMKVGFKQKFICKIYLQGYLNTKSLSKLLSRLKIKLWK